MGYKTTRSQLRRKAARKMTRAESNDEIERWLKDQGATESVTFDERTGKPLRTFTIDLTK